MPINQSGHDQVELNAVNGCFKLVLFAAICLGLVGFIALFNYILTL